MDKVKIYIPIDTDERLLIRDEIARSLRNSYDVVIIHFLSIFNQSVIEVFVHDITSEVKFFEGITDLISNKIHEPVLLEIRTETKYIGVMEGDLNDSEKIQD